MRITKAQMRVAVDSLLNREIYEGATYLVENGLLVFPHLCLETAGLDFDNKRVIALVKSSGELGPPNLLGTFQAYIRQQGWSDHRQLCILTEFLREVLENGFNDAGMVSGRLAQFAVFLDKIAERENTS